MKKIQIISASAGSGKTFRLAQLLEAAVAERKVRPQCVVATTFTNKAAAELQERVRVRLLTAGRTAGAQQLTAARIGTVNSVSGRLVGDFAFELGLSPQLRVLDEKQAAMGVYRSISAVLTASEEAELAHLADRLGEFKWQATVHRIIDLARANGIASDSLLRDWSRSWQSFETLLGTPGESAVSLDQALLDAGRRFLSQVQGGKDSTKVTRTAKEVVNSAVRRMQVGHALPWKDWVKLAKLKAATVSDDFLKPIRAAAEAQDRHPRLHADLRRTIELSFTLAARAMSAYQQHKRELGVLDFIDQEGYARQLLGRPDVREALSGEIDLVLVDEFQDTSPIQLSIFLQLADLAPHSIWVGDQKQAIYGFRGTDPALMDAAIEAVLGGGEPETLGKSYRSRPGLVRFTSALFVPAFAGQGMPPSRVELEPSTGTEPDGLGPFIECWELCSENAPGDAAALAAAVRLLLNDPDVRVRERANGQPRRPRASDVAVLCRANEQCLRVAEALAALGIRPVLPRQGLLSTLEGRAAMAGLRRWVDEGDTLAAAELARMVDFAGQEDQWLSNLLERPGAAAFSELPALAALRRAREAEPHLGVVGVFDAVSEAVGLSELCHRWGDTPARLANLEAFRGHVVAFTQACAAIGAGCTPAGLIAYLLELQREGADSQGVDEDDHAVVVSTWHGAKGLEWPVVVLYPLTRYDTQTRALGVQVASDQPKVDLADPLVGRWIRFWPNPYASNNNGMPFHARLAADRASALARAQAEREDLRLLYVGWTRARDRVVLAGREGKVVGNLLELLRDAQGPLVSEPDGTTLNWAGQRVPVVRRQAEPQPAQPPSRRPSESYAPAGVRPYPAAFIQPSSLKTTITPLQQFERIGTRIHVTGNGEWSAMGSAIHAFLCADRPGLSAAAREKLLAETLGSWKVSQAFRPEDLITAADVFRGWVESKWPGAQWCREWPVFYREPDGSILRGSSDLVLVAGEGFVVIDHKSFPGTDAEALERAAGHAGQLQAYTKAVAAATGKPVLAVWVHLPTCGIVVPVPE